jgi:hypothetical protein
MNRSVTLNYDKKADNTAVFKPDPETIVVNPNTDTLTFVLGRGPEDGKIVITFHEPQFFSRGQFNDGEGVIAIKPSLKKRTTYRCELFVNGKIEATADGQDGGGVQPLGGDD